MWDRAVSDLRARRRDGRAVRAGGDARDLPGRLRRRGAARAATSPRGARSRPPPRRTRCSATSPGAPTTRARRCGAATRRTAHSTTCSPPPTRSASRCSSSSMTEDPAGVSFARSRAEVVAALATSMRAAGVAAMVYPTMPFNAPRAVDRRGRTSAPRSATATGSACPRCRSQRARRGRHAGAQPVDRRASGRGRARARAGACVRATVAAVRHAAAQGALERVRPHFRALFGRDR